MGFWDEALGLAKGWLSDYGELKSAAKDPLSVIGRVMGGGVRQVNMPRRTSYDVPYYLEREQPLELAGPAPFPYRRRRGRGISAADLRACKRVQRSMKALGCSCGAARYPGRRKRRC